MFEGGLVPSLTCMVLGSLLVGPGTFLVVSFSCSQFFSKKIKILGIGFLVDHSGDYFGMHDDEQRRTIGNLGNLVGFELRNEDERNRDDDDDEGTKRERGTEKYQEKQGTVTDFCRDDSTLERVEVEVDDVRPRKTY